MNKKVQLLMKEYFSYPVQNREELYDCPITPSKETWSVFESPERLEKKFSFSSRSQAKDFVIEIMNIEDSMFHHGKITIDHTDVSVSVYTKDLNRITNRDKEYAKHVDNIFRDVQDYKYG